MLVSVSHDRSVRVWEKSEEQVFLEEEQEKRLEAVFDADLDGVRRKFVTIFSFVAHECDP